MAGNGRGKRRRDRKSRLRRAALRHPLRRQILRLMSDGAQVGADEIASELDEGLTRITYHLRILVRRRALRAAARGRRLPALYRWSPQAHWARKMLGEDRS